MANSKQAKKRIRQNSRNKIRNVSIESSIKTLLKNMKRIISLKQSENMQEEFNKMQSILDHYSCKGLIHKNKVSRYKSRLGTRVNQILHP